MSNIHDEPDWPLGRIFLWLVLLFVLLLRLSPDFSEFVANIIHPENRTILKIKAGDHELELKGH
jgi:hypothetical protein